MGCCASEDDHSRKSDMDPINKNLQFSWNSNQLQAKAFIVDGANLRLTADKKQPHRICSKHPFPKSGSFSVKIRYVQKKGKGSFSLGICHFGNRSQTERIEKIGMKNVVRLFVSEREGEIQSQGDVVFHSREWATKETDTIVMMVNLASGVVEWRKEDNMSRIVQKTALPASFSGRNLYFELIVYQPETELNIQAGREQ